jgi:hypothetical protein
LAAGWQSPTIGGNERRNTRPTIRAEQSDTDLRRRPVRYGLHRFLHLPDPALRVVAWYERERDRPFGRRPVAARGVFIDPYRRVDGPVRHAPGDAVLCLVGDRVGTGLSVIAVVLAVIVVADRQRRRFVVCLVGRADADRPTRRRRSRIYRPLQLFCSDRHHRGTDRRRSRLGFRRCLAGLCHRRAVGRGADGGTAVGAGGEGANRAGAGWRVSPARITAAQLGLCELLRADGHPGGRDDDGDHLSAHRDDGRPIVALHHLSARDWDGRHDDRPAVRGGRNLQRAWAPVRRPGDAARRPAKDDADRHGRFDCVDLRNAVSRWLLRAAARREHRPRLAAGRGAADDVLGAGEGCRPLSPGRRCRAAADDEPAGGDRHSTNHGGDRRQLGRECELCHSRRCLGAAVRADRPHHTAHREARGGEKQEGCGWTRHWPPPEPRFSLTDRAKCPRSASR